MNQTNLYNLYGNVGLSVGPPRQTIGLDCHDIGYRHPWSGPQRMNPNDSGDFTSAPPASQNVHLTGEIHLVVY